MPTEVARVKELFLAVLDLPAPERNAYLDTACAGDTALRQQIEAMLSSHQNSGELLQRPAGEMLADTGNTEAEATAAFAKSNVTGTQVDSVGGAAHDLTFLTPATKPDCLGQLGHYTVQNVIGKGGFGIVLKAFDERLHRVVAIKVLAPAYAANGSARKRFIREARTAAAVKNEHVVGIYDVEEDAQPPYLAMEMIDGVSLQDKLDQHGPLGVKEILRIGMQTAEGLAAAHKQGLVHRDIKPGNILLENGVERVKITDFGLARAVDDASVTQSGTVAGTPMYMSPEQAEGLPIDLRSDLFSLGTVLYAMCTGHPPFRASGTHAVLKRVIDASPRPIREINNEIPEWLCDIIRKLHAKKPEDRFQTAQEVAELLGQRLADVQAGREIGRAPTPDPRGSQSLTPRLGTEDMTFKPRGESSSPAGGTPATTRPGSPGRERRALAAILSVVAVIALVVYFTGTWRGTDKKDDVPTHATVVLGGLYDPLGLEKVLLHRVKITNERMERTGKHVVELKQENAFLKKRTKSEAALRPGMYQIEVVCRPGYILAKHQISPETPGLHTHGEGQHVGMLLDLKAGDRVTIQVSVEKERDGNWVKLFNGKNLDGWQKHPTEAGDWTVENGVLVGKSGRLGYLFSERSDFANFHLRAKVKVNAGGDSGIFVRSKLGPMVEGKRKDYVGKKSPPGYEAQICNDASALRTGSLFLVQEGAEPALTREERKLVPPDQWCTLEVIADGPWLTVKVNGERTANVKNDVYTRGHIALQMWHDKTAVHFEKIEIKELPPTATLPDSPEQVLPALAGAWKGEYTQKIYGGKPDVKKISAVCVNDWIVGQKWLRQRVQLGDESFQSVTTYEPGAKAFRDYFFHSRGLIFGPSTGRWESATRTLTWTNLPEAGVVLLMTLRFVDANTFTGEILIRDKEGKTAFEMSSLMKRTAENIAIDKSISAGPLPKEMAVLDRIVGDWQTTGIIKNAKYPDGLKSTWQSSSRKILGGRVIATQRSGDAGDDESYSLATFDTFSKAYGRWSFRANGNVMEYHGLWDEENQTLRWHWASKDGSQSSNTWPLRDPNRRDWQVVTKDAFGKTTFEVQATSIRPKDLKWNVIDPMQDSQVGVSNGRIDFRLPGKARSLILTETSRQFDAPRMLTKVSGDFTLNVLALPFAKPLGEHIGRGTPFVGAGLMIWQDEDHFVTLLRQKLGKLPSELAIFQGASKGKHFKTPPVASKPFKADSPPVWLRLERKGEVVRGYFSLDGKMWDLVREQIVDFGKDVRVGVVAVQNTKDGYQAELDHFAIRVGSD